MTVCHRLSKCRRQSRRQKRKTMQQCRTRTPIPPSCDQLNASLHKAPAIRRTVDKIIWRQRMVCEMCCMHIVDISIAANGQNKSRFGLSLSNSWLNFSRFTSKNLLSSRSRKSERESPAPPLNPIFEAENPDELALVHAANAYGVRLLQRHLNTIMLQTPDGRHHRWERNAR